MSDPKARKIVSFSGQVPLRTFGEASDGAFKSKIQFYLLRGFDCLACENGLSFIVSIHLSTLVKRL